jgi:hypothetical protein
MNGKQELERIVGLVKQWQLLSYVEYPPSLLQDIITSAVAWQGLTVDWNCFNDPYPLYSRGKGVN